MTEKQKRFCDEYLIDCNGTRAYKAVYPNVKKDETAKAAASRLLTNVDVKSFINEQLEKLHNEKTADAQEVMEYLTSVMRGESQSEIVVVLGVGDGYSKASNINKSPDEKERLKAAELIGKRYGIFDKNNLEKDNSGIADFIEATAPKDNEIKELFNDE